MPSDAGEIYRAALTLAVGLALLILRAVWGRLDRIQATVERLNATVIEVRNDQTWIKEKVERLEKLWNGTL